MNKRVIILVFAHKPQLDFHEQISLQQCYRILGKHPIRLVCPEGMDVSAFKLLAPSMVVDYIPGKWLESLQAYNRLKIHSWLYKRYTGFDFILTYELDAFVFRDELLDWCAQEWDYIGAPWFRGYYHAEPDAEPDGVGNSGFSLRRTAAILKVSHTLRYQQTVGDVFAAWSHGEWSLKKSLAALTIRNNFFSPFNKYYGQEDLYWGKLVRGRLPWFRVPSHETARKFAFDGSPSRLYSECSNQLPFGCHGWNRVEPEFWREHIKANGFDWG